MTTALIGMVLSGISIVILAILFRIEEQRGTRVLGTLRVRFDERIASLLGAMHRASRYLGRDVTRQSAHYFVHLILHSIERTMSFVLHQVSKLQHTNRALAHRAKNDTGVRTQLDELQNHKEETALSPKQRKAHKEESVGTRL